MDEEFEALNVEIENLRREIMAYELRVENDRLTLERLRKTLNRIGTDVMMAIDITKAQP